MKELETFKIPLSICPVCGHKMDCASEPARGGHPPKAGDLGLCLKCGEILVYGDDQKLRQAGVDDLLEIPPHIEDYLNKWQAKIRAERPIK